MAAGSGERIGGIVGVVEGGGFLNVIASVSEAICFLSALENRGRRECRMRAAPAVSYAMESR